MKTLRQTLTIAACLPMMAFAQMQVTPQVLDNPENQPLPCHPVPSERQLLWNETEFYAFFHYGMNTFTGKEWGNGDENESIYAPTAEPNPRQWLEAVKAAGMKGGIAVVKHHDGFCLWPTKTTTHNITRGGGQYASTNIPKLFAEAAKDLKLKYGFYVSPWDRNSEFYGEDNYVTDVFLKQCEELAEYGSDQFEMWFDGANGGTGYYGGKGGNRSIDNSYYYDIPNLRDRVHRIAPNCVMWGVGGEARWIGNEAGWAGETCWAMLNPDVETNALRQTGQEDSWLWHPGESDAKATTGGWFWHNGENVLGLERLFQMYLETVGRNATWILNCPPDQTGSLPQATVNRLREFGELLKTRLSTDLAKTAQIEVSEVRQAGTGRNYETANMTDDNKETYWATNNDTKSAVITLTWNTPQTIRYLMMQEYVKLGQRVKEWKVEYSANGTTWQELATNVQTTTIGYKRILPLNGSTGNSYGNGYSAKALRITIEDSRACPTLSRLSVY